MDQLLQQQRKFLGDVRANNAAAIIASFRAHPDLDVNWRYPDGRGRTYLHYACEYDTENAVPALLSLPGIDANARDSDQRTPLHLSVIEHYPGCTELLLAHRGTDPNLRDYLGKTPLWHACEEIGIERESAELLLAYRGTDPNITDNSGDSIIKDALWDGNWLAVKMLLASPRLIELGALGADWAETIKETIQGALGVDKYDGYTEVVELIERYRQDPTAVRYALRLELGLSSSPSRVFTTGVFLSEELLQVGEKHKDTAAARFWAVMLRMPMELQMLLSHRQAGSTGEFVSGIEADLAARELAWQIRENHFPPVEFS